MEVLLGAAVNGLGILVGGGLGVLLKARIQVAMRTKLMRVLGLFVMVIGLKTAWPLPEAINVMVSLAMGAGIGGVLRLGEHLRRWTEGMGRWSGTGRINAAVYASLVFNVGAMALVGSVQAGTAKVPIILESKAILDGLTAMLLASVSGVGVLGAAVITFAYEGGLSLAAGGLHTVLSDLILANVESVGGFMILAIGMNFLWDEERIPVVDLLPALLVSIALSGVGQALGWRFL